MKELNTIPADSPLSQRAQRREQYLKQVASIVCKDRNIAHGDAEDNFATIAEFWSVYVQRRFGVTFQLNALDVADMMVLFKVARAAANPLNAENRFDIGGYAACGAGIAYEMRDEEDSKPAPIAGIWKEPKP